MRNIGNMAEHLLSMWCSEAGLTVNPSSSDDMGWDHFIEFPLSNVISSSKIHQSAPKCKVQVKATDKQDRKLQVSLSNLYKMAVDPLPFFFLFVEYDGKNSVQKTFLRLVDNNLIRQILKKVHKINASSKENKFNKKTMLVKYDESHALSELSGEFLKSAMKKCFTDGFNKFIADKKTFIEKVGYEDGALEIKFNTVGEPNLEKLIDVSLGIEKAVSIEQIIAIDKRFGIATEESTLSSSTALLSMPNLQPTTEANLIFQKGPFDDVYSFSVDVYFPPFINDLNSPYFKSRFKSDFFDIVFSHKTSRLNFSFNFGNKHYDVQYLRKTHQFISDLSSGDKFNVYVEGKQDKQLIGSINADNQFINYQEELETLVKVTDIVKYFDLNDSLRLSTHELFYLKDSIQGFHDLLFSSQRNFKVGFNLVDGVVDLDNEHVVLGCLQFLIGDQFFSILYSAEGILSLSDEDTFNRYELIDKGIKIEKKLVCSKGSIPSKVDIYQELKLLELKYPDRPLITLEK
jgi:hypothetical protein